MLYKIRTHENVKYTNDYKLYYENHGVSAYLNKQINKYILPLGEWIAL